MRYPILATGNYSHRWGDGLGNGVRTLKNYWQSNPQLADTMTRHGLGPADIAPGGLPSEYDNVSFETVINGIHVHTVGEYKAQLESWTVQPDTPTTWDHI